MVGLFSVEPRRDSVRKHIVLNQCQDMNCLRLPRFAFPSSTIAFTISLPHRSFTPVRLLSSVIIYRIFSHSHYFVLQPSMYFTLCIPIVRTLTVNLMHPIPSFTLVHFNSIAQYHVVGLDSA